MLYDICDQLHAIHEVKSPSSNDPTLVGLFQLVNERVRSSWIATSWIATSIGHILAESGGTTTGFVR